MTYFFQKANLMDMSWRLKSCTLIYTDINFFKNKTARSEWKLDNYFVTNGKHSIQEDCEETKSLKVVRSYFILVTVQNNTKMASVKSWMTASWWSAHCGVCSSEGNECTVLRHLFFRTQWIKKGRGSVYWQQVSDADERCILWCDPKIDIYGSVKSPSTTMTAQ